MRNNFYIFIVIMMTSLGCSIMPKKIDIVSTPPGAEVIIYDQKDNHKLLGVTPLSIDEKDFKNFQDQILHFKVNKNGYINEQIYITKIDFGLHGAININLTPTTDWNSAYQNEDALKYLSDVAKLAAQIQSHTINKDFINAEDKAKILTTRYPKLAVGWNLLGNVYYLQKRIGQAIESYKKSYELDPNDSATKDVLNRISGQQGVN